MNVHRSVSELIGDTPLVELVNFERDRGLGATVLGKVESFNPAGSVKDRIARAMAGSTPTRSSSSPPRETPASAWRRWRRRAATA